MSNLGDGDNNNRKLDINNLPTICLGNIFHGLTIAERENVDEAFPDIAEINDALPTNVTTLELNYTLYNQYELTVNDGMDQYTWSVNNDHARRQTNMQFELKSFKYSGSRHRKMERLIEKYLSKSTCRFKKIVLKGTPRFWVSKKRIRTDLLELNFGTAVVNQLEAFHIFLNYVDDDTETRVYLPQYDVPELLNHDFFRLRNIQYFLPTFNIPRILSMNFPNFKLSISERTEQPHQKFKTFAEKLVARREIGTHIELSFEDESSLGVIVFLQEERGWQPVYVRDGTAVKFSTESRVIQVSTVEVQPSRGDEPDYQPMLIEILPKSK